VSESDRTVRVAVVGGHRGSGYGRALDSLAGQVELTAICDLDPGVVAGWKETRPALRGFTRYEDLLDSGAADAVFLATPMALHASQAVAALDAGLHVLSEVIAATTLEECWALVESVERSGRTYMLAENYCYMRPNMLVRRLADAGRFGAVYYAEGAYLHDCRHLGYTPDGALTWRGELSRAAPGNVYPTHSLGPVAQWLGTAGPAATDRLVEVTCLTTPNLARRRYAVERFGADHPTAAAGFFTKGDSATTVLVSERGSVAHIRVDANSPRPHNMTHYALQGTEGAYLSARHGGEDPLIWLDGRSPGVSPGDAAWEPLWAYADEFEHPHWRAHGAAARQAGHGGGDFFILRDFAAAVAGRTPPPIDVYDAVTWSSVYPLSQQSVRERGRAVAIPDFRRAAAGRARGAAQRPAAPAPAPVR
jgi:predicted dehydrogenase